MALITCVDCGGKVSPRAAACPHCGAPPSIHWAYQEAQATRSRVMSRGRVGWWLGLPLLAAVLLTISIRLPDAWRLAGPENRRPAVGRTLLTPSPVAASPEPAGNVAETPALAEPDTEVIAATVKRLQGAPFYFAGVGGHRGADGEPIYTLTLRQRVSLDQCGDHDIAAAARQARQEIGGKDGRAHAEAASARIVALTRFAPDCYTGWEWLANVSFLLGHKEDFQRAVGRMIELGLHECVKQETWLMMQKALRRDWLEPFALDLHRPGVMDTVGIAAVFSINHPGHPDLFHFEDYGTAQPGEGKCLAAMGSPMQLYVGAAKDYLADGFGVKVYLDCIYRGEFKQGKKQGRGILTYPNGLTLSGEFADDDWAFNGIVSGNGVDFLSNSKADGKILQKVGPLVFQGAAVDGQMQRGIIYHSEAKNSWQGEFVENRLDGYGLMTFADGTRVEGEFKGGEPTRKTRIVDAHGDAFYWVADEDGGQKYRSDDGRVRHYHLDR